MVFITVVSPACVPNIAAKPTKGKKAAVVDILCKTRGFGRLFEEQLMFTNL